MFYNSIQNAFCSIPLQIVHVQCSRTTISNNNSNNNCVNDRKIHDVDGRLTNLVLASVESLPGIDSFNDTGSNTSSEYPIHVTGSNTPLSLPCKCI
jgi:hypothetical protein